MKKILHGCLHGIGTVSSNEKKTMLEYVRSGEFLFGLPTYLEMDFIHMRIIVIVIVAIS